MAKPKTKEELTPTAPLYDRTAEQVIRLTIDGEISVSHTLSPPSDPRYHQFLNDIDDATPTETRDLQSKLWEELCTSATGYAERAKWQSAIPLPHRIATMETLLLSIPSLEKSNASVFDIDAPRTIGLIALFGEDQLETLKLRFRHPSQGDLEEFLLLSENEPNPTALASAVKTTKSERKEKLAKKLKVNQEGYVEDPPLYHLLTAFDVHMTAEIFSAKKSIKPVVRMPSPKS